MGVPRPTRVTRSFSSRDSMVGPSLLYRFSCSGTVLPPINGPRIYPIKLAVKPGKMAAVSSKYVVAGEIYRDAEMDLQLPRSHLAFRIPAGSSGRLSADGAFKIFSSDRNLSCFVFVHGAGEALPTNWMSDAFALDGETLVAVGEQTHAQSDTVYRAFEGATLLAYKFEKTNRQGAGFHGSAVALKSEADRLSVFLKPILSSLHRGEAVSSPTPKPAPRPGPIPVPSPPPPPPPPPPTVPPRDRRLVGLWPLIGPGCYPARTRWLFPASVI